MKKTLLKRFEPAQFTKPDAFYWPGYIWFWNDNLSKKVLTSQLEDMSSCQARSVWPLPAPRDFRPTTMPTFLEPAYLSEEYMERYRHVVQEARRLGMKVWLYDEGGWPSGMVCGRIVKKNPALAQQTLGRVELKPKKGEEVQVPKESLSAFLYRANNRVRPLTPGAREIIKFDNARIEIFRINRIDPALIHSDQPVNAAAFYPDLLNPESTREFIRMTHEVFKKAVGEYFGATIPLVFIDEAGVTNLPWTDDLVSDFKRKMGYDIRERLPDIFKADKPEGKQTRIDYYDWWSQRFAEAFWRQIQRWCRKNGVLLAGHLGGDGDSGSLGVRFCGFGHPLRILRELDIPGVDAIWRQIFPGKKKTVFVNPANRLAGQIYTCENHHFAKYASTVAHQEGKPWAITESFAVYGAGLTPEQMKWITDFQYVRGTNLTTMGGYSLSTREYFMGAQRPLFGCNNPLWPYMDVYHTYTARMSYLLSLGKPAIETAVYYPVRDLWAAGPDIREVAVAAVAHDALIKVLLENQCDFDLVDDDMLARPSTRTIDGKLQVGPMRYHTVCVSQTRWMDKKSKAKLAQFIAGGGKVLWVDDRKNTAKPDGAIDLGFSELARRIAPLVQVEPGNRDFRVCKRQLANGNLYFITNESMKATKGTLTFAESLPPVQIDPETGCCRQPSGSLYSNGAWSIPLNLKFAGSAVFLFTREKLALSAEPMRASRALLNLKSGWSCRRVRAYLIGEHDFEVKKMDGQARPAELGDWRGVFGQDFSGDAEYRVDFECSRETAAQAAFLDLGKVNYVCQAVLNGKKLGKKVWRPFSFPVQGIIKPGKNELKVVVTNTMANQYVTTKKLEQYPLASIGPYHRLAAQLEKDSLPSGLYGPVRIYAHCADRGTR